VTSDVTTTATEIDMSDAQTTVDLTTLNTNDYLQFTISSTPGAYTKEIMLIKDVNVSGQKITVKRGMFNTKPETFSTSATYYIMLNKMSIGGEGRQVTTTKGYVNVGYGWSQITANHVKGNGALFTNHIAGTVLKNTSSTVIFDADAKTMSVTGNDVLKNYRSSGDTFTFFASGTSANMNSRFTVKSYKYSGGAGIFYLKEAPVSETVADSLTTYFEPGLINNCSFAHNTGISGTEIVKGWSGYYKQYNQFSASGSTTYISQESSGLYSDANIFGADKSAEYYPYADKSLSITADYATTNLVLNENITATETVLKTNLLGIYDSSRFGTDDILKIDN
jgi:hypothetical protein